MLLLTITAMMIQTGIHTSRDSTMIVPTMFAFMNITAHTNTLHYIGYENIVITTP